jgi:hypothetical protein
MAKITQQAKMLTILDYVRTNGACHDIDIIQEVVPAVCANAKEVLLLLEDLSNEGEIVECRYVASLDNYRLRSIFFPKNAQVSLFNCKKGIYGEKHGPR